MSALSLPKSLFSRLGLTTTTPPGAAERVTSDSHEQETVTKDGNTGDDDGTTLSIVDVAEVALVLSLDNLAPRQLAAFALSCSRLRDVSCSGVCWRTRFEPRLPAGVTRRLDDAEREASATRTRTRTRRRSSSASTSASASTKEKTSRSCSSFFGWPSTYAALSLSNLLRSPLEWEGVSRGMRASYYSSDDEQEEEEEEEEDEQQEEEGSEGRRRRYRRRLWRRSRRGHTSVSSCVFSPPWRVTCHGGHGWEVEREGPAGADEEIVGSSSSSPSSSSSEEKEKDFWPPALLPRSSLSPSSRSVVTAAAAPSALSAPSSSTTSWLRRSLHLGSSSASSPSAPPPPPSLLPKPLSVAASFSWCEIVQEVDLVFELCRATSWVECRSTAVEGDDESESENDDDEEIENGDDDENEETRRRGFKTRNLSWTREDAESYLDSAAAESSTSPSPCSPSPSPSPSQSPKLVLSFSCASRRDCESQFSAQLLALPDPKETGPLPPYHGRPDYDWASRARALASSELSERAAPWDRGEGRGKWHRVTLPPLAVPAGTRRALVVLRSKDSRFWSGHYGAKFAAPVLAFAATGAEVEAAESAARATEEAREEAAAARELLFAP